MKFFPKFSIKQNSSEKTFLNDAIHIWILGPMSIKNCDSIFWITVTVIKLLLTAIRDVRITSRRSWYCQFRGHSIITPSLGADTNLEWSALNYNLIITTRQTMFISGKNNKKKVGLNALANRLFVVNNLVPLAWLNMAIETFKIHCKRKFITAWITPIIRSE